MFLNAKRLKNKKFIQDAKLADFQNLGIIQVTKIEKNIPKL
mgnify:CR=1 FL=1